MDANKTISISVKLFALLAHYKPNGVESSSFTMEIENGMSVEQFILVHDLPAEKIKTISLNDKLVKKTATLQDGDRLILFPTIAGG